PLSLSSLISDHTAPSLCTSYGQGLYRPSQFFLNVMGANVGAASGGPHFLCASRRDSEAGGLSFEQLERLYQHLTQRLKNAPPFSVVRLPVELPFEAPVDARFVYYR